MKYKKFQHKVTEEGLPQGPNFRRTNQSISTFGYSDFSPYRNEPYLDIFSPNGVIDMSNTGIPLLANGRYLAPYSGLHQFDTPWIEERRLPLAQGGLEFRRYGKDKKPITDIPESGQIFVTSKDDPLYKEYAQRRKLYKTNQKNWVESQREQLEKEIKDHTPTAHYQYSADHIAKAQEKLRTLGSSSYDDFLKKYTEKYEGIEDDPHVGLLDNNLWAYDNLDGIDNLSLINQAISDSSNGWKAYKDFYINKYGYAPDMYMPSGTDNHFSVYYNRPNLRVTYREPSEFSNFEIEESKPTPVIEKPIIEKPTYPESAPEGYTLIKGYKAGDGKWYGNKYVNAEGDEQLAGPTKEEGALMGVPGLSKFLPKETATIENKKYGGYLPPLMNEGGSTIDVDNFKNKVSELDTLFKQGTVDESDASVQDTLIEFWKDSGMNYNATDSTKTAGTFLDDFGNVDPSKIYTTSWSGATINELTKALFGKPQWHMRHSTALKKMYDKNSAYDKPIDLNQETKEFNVGDVLGRGRKNTKNWSLADFEKEFSKGNDKLKSHFDIIVGKGKDDKGSYYEVAGGNRGGTAGGTFKKSKVYYDSETKELKNGSYTIGSSIKSSYRGDDDKSKTTSGSETTTGGEDMSQYIKMLQGYLARGKKGEGSKTGVNPEQLKMMQQMMQMAQQQPGMMQQLGMTQAPRMPRITADEFKYKRRPRKTKIKAKNISVMKKGGSFNLHNSAKNSKLYNMGGNIQNQSTDDINSQRNSKFVEYLTSTSDAYKMDQMMKMMQESGITPNMLPIPQMNLGGMSSSDLVDMQNKDIQNRMDLFQSGMNMLDNPFDLVYDEGKSKIGRQKSLDKVLGTKWYEFGEKAKRNKAAREGATEMYKAQGYLDPETRRTFAGRMLHPFQPYRDTGYRDVKQNLGVQDFLEMNKQAILGVDKYGNPIGSNAYVGGFERAFPYLQTRRLGGSGLKRYQTTGEVLGQTSDEILLGILNKYLSDDEVNKINEVLTSTGVGEDVESKLASPAFQKAYKNAILKLSSNKDAKAELDAYTNMMSRAINLGYNPEGRATPLSGRFLFDSGTVRNPAYEDYIMKERLAQNNPELLAYIESLNPGFLDDRYLTDQVSFEELLGGRNFKSLPPNQQLALIENFRRGVIGPDVDENLYLGDLAAPELRASHLRPTGHPNQTIQEFTLPADGSMITGTGAGSGYQPRPIYSSDEINEASRLLGLPRVFDARLRGQQAAASPVVDNDDVDDTNVDDTDDGGGDNNVVVNDGGDDNVVVDDKDEKDETVVDTSGKDTPQGYWGMAPFLHAHDFQNKVKRGLFGNTKNKFKAKGLSVGFTPYYTGAMDGSQPIAPRPILPYEIVAPGTTGVVDPRNVDPRLIDRVRDKASDVVDNVRDRSDRGRRRERRIGQIHNDALRDEIRIEKDLNKQEKFSDRQDKRNEKEQRRQLNQQERELNKQGRLAARDARVKKRLMKRLGRQYEQGGAFGHINTAAYGMGGDYNLPMAQLGRGMFSRDKENIFADLNENPGMYLNTRIQPTQGSTYSNFDNFQTERRFRDKLYDLFHPNTRRVAMTPGGFRDGGPLRKYQNDGEVEETEDKLYKRWQDEIARVAELTDEDRLTTLMEGAIGTNPVKKYDTRRYNKHVAEGLYGCAATGTCTAADIFNFTNIEGAPIDTTAGTATFSRPKFFEEQGYQILPIGAELKAGDVWNRATRMKDGKRVVQGHYQTILDPETGTVVHNPGNIKSGLVKGRMQPELSGDKRARAYRYTGFADEYKDDLFDYLKSQPLERIDTLPIRPIELNVDRRPMGTYGERLDNDMLSQNLLTNKYGGLRKYQGDEDGSEVLSQALTKYAGDTGTYTQGSGDYDKRAFNQSMIKANPSIIEDLGQEAYNAWAGFRSNLPFADHEHLASNMRETRFSPDFTPLENAVDKIYSNQKKVANKIIDATAPEWLMQYRANKKWQSENMPNQAYGGEQYKLGQEVYLDGGQIQDMINKGYKIQYF